MSSGWRKIRRSGKNPEISYIKNDRILFSAPIPGESGSRRVVVGSQYYEELKTLSNLADYQEYAVSILMNEKNQEVITLKCRLRCFF